MINLLNKLQDLLDLSRKADFVAPLLLRLYLTPIFWMAGTQKLGHFSDTVEWFGNPDWGLGLPFPLLMASMAVATEIGGAILLTVGLATRWISIPLLFTMLVAAVTVHLENGWLAISAAGGPFATERTVGAIDRLDRAKSILQEHANYEWLTENGSLVILNNGIEFAATYMLMLLALLFIGGGRYVSTDYWLARRYRTNSTTSQI
jgi:putative oxidoreductase